MSKLENYRIPLPAHTKLAYRPSSKSISATSSKQNGSKEAASSVPFEGHDDPDGGFFYIRDFITEEEEQFLLEKVRRDSDTVFVINGEENLRVSASSLLL